MRVSARVRDHAPRVLVIVAAMSLSASATFALAEEPEPATPPDPGLERMAPRAGGTNPFVLDEAVSHRVVLDAAPAPADWRSRWAMRPGSPCARSSLLAAPQVVRFRPRAGWTDVAQDMNLSVRFTSAMDHATTVAAFTASIDGVLIVGRTRWAEGDTVLVLDPEAPLPRGSVVTLAVAASARSAFGVPLAGPADVSFTVTQGPTPPAAPARAASPAVGSQWTWPLRGPITQRFGESLTSYGVHKGIDIDGDTGDAVRAARAGRVTVAGHFDDCGGLEIHIDHGDGLSSWYRHLSRIDVRAGVDVAGGTVIGAVGNTGCSLGSHLHFAIRRGSAFVDPLDFLPRR